MKNIIFLLIGIGLGYIESSHLIVWYWALILLSSINGLAGWLIGLMFIHEDTFGGQVLILVLSALVTYWIINH
jgi:hypothetical protein